VAAHEIALAGPNLGERNEVPSSQISGGG
jgi:hypothetical protein